MLWMWWRTKGCNKMCGVSPTGKHMKSAPAVVVWDHLLSDVFWGSHDWVEPDCLGGGGGGGMQLTFCFGLKEKVFWETTPLRMKKSWCTSGQYELSVNTYNSTQSSEDYRTTQWEKKNRGGTRKIDSEQIQMGPTVGDALWWMWFGVSLHHKHTSNFEHGSPPSSSFDLWVIVLGS